MQFKTVADVAAVVTGARLAGSRDTEITGFSTDSRSVKPGEVFIALEGDNFDGHDYIDVAIHNGAAAAVVATSWVLDREETARAPYIIVNDPLTAYGEIARAYRRAFQHPVVAVAGSNGKTTTKELIAAVLGARFNVHKTTGNLNNQIGVPATILQISDEHTAAVIEIGTNMPGEIETLCAILEPTHGIITNVGREHLELLGSIEGVAEEEGALFRYLDAHGGTSFVNLDDPQIVRIAGGVEKKVTYSIRSRADVCGDVERLTEGGAPVITLDEPGGASHTITLRLPGLHSATNAIAVAAVGKTFGIPLAEIKEILENFEPLTYSSGYARLAPARAHNGALILNDTYNANPDSMLVAFDTLRAMPLAPGGRKFVVLGEMRELGASSATEHADLGRELASGGGIDGAFLFGPEMKHAQAALEQAGFPTQHFDDKKALIEQLRASLNANDIVLVKGSRGTKMEDVVSAVSRGN